MRNGATGLSEVKNLMVDVYKLQENLHMKNIFINDRPIIGHPPYLIAELSANHNGSLQRALDTISEAKRVAQMQ